MGNRIGGKEVRGIIIREEGAIAEAEGSHKGNSRYVEQQLGKIKKAGLVVGVLSAGPQEAIELKFGNLFNETGEKLVVMAVGEATVDMPQEELSLLFATTILGMRIDHGSQVALFSQLDSDFAAATELGIIRVRTGRERKAWDNACADNLTSLLALIDRD